MLMPDTELTVAHTLISHFCSIQFNPLRPSDCVPPVFNIKYPTFCPSPPPPTQYIYVFFTELTHTQTISLHNVY